MVRAACGVVAMFALLCVGASSAWAGIGFSPTINIPQPNATVTVGQSNLPSQVRFVNISDSPQDTQTLTLSNITVVPACGVNSFVGSDCPTPDPGVIAIDTTATGRAGTACAGNTFSVTNISPGVQDKYLFTPLGGPVVLGPSDGSGPLPISCIIDFTVDILKSPTIDAIPGGTRQTGNIASANGVTTDGSSGQASQTNTTTILAATLTATTVASTVAPFTSFSDSITLGGVPAGSPAPTGTVTFLAYGPNDLGCAGAPMTQGPLPLTGLTTSSGPFDPPGPGDYTFRVTYSGDLNYAGFTTACGEPNETVNIPAPVIQVVKTASPLTRVEPGGTFTFTLVVSNPSPNVPITITTLTDNIYGNIGTDPAASNTCDDLIGDVLAPGASSAPCSFDGTFTGAAPASQTDIVTVLGTDANGFTATDTDDAVVSLLPLPQIQVVKTASPLSRLEPGGTFTFTVVVTNPSPNNPITITTLTDNIYGNIGTDPAPSNTCDDLIGVTLAPGASSAPCSFDGTFTGAAGASQTDVVSVLGTDANGNTATDTDDAVVTLLPLPQIQVVKTASPLSRVEPGGTFTFTVVVSNPSPVNPITITTLTDNIYGNIGTDPAASNTCDDLIGDVLAPGASSAPCSFDGTFTGVAGASQTDVVSVLGTDANGNTATDTDDAVVTLLPLPQIQVVKTASPLSRLEPGGTFTFTLVVSNPSPINPITITTLTDNIYGNIGTDPAASNTCDDLIGDVLAPGASSAPCSFDGTFTGAAGASQTDVVTVLGTDANGNTATDTDDAVVTLLPLPQIQVVKTASPLSRLEPGGTFTFTVVVSNPSPINPITITTLTDNIYGNIGTNPAASNTCDDLIGDVLAPGASSAPCSFEGNFTGAAGASQTDVVTVLGTDANGNTATDTDDAVVTLLPLPQIQVVKTASPLSRVEPGGTFTFTLVVSNPSPINPITITTLTDNIYGNIGTNPAASNTCDDLIGDTLAPGASSAPCSFEGSFTGAAGASQTDIVTVLGTDANGNTATDTDDAVVTITPLPQIQVVKTASPLSRLEPGGTFTFSLVVSNPGPIAITITTLTDNIYGNIGTNPAASNTCDDLIGDVLAPGASSAPCSFEGDFNGAAGASQTDVVTVLGTDVNGNTATDTDDAVVTLLPLPQIQVVKTASPLSRVEPGGTFTFTLVVSNPSPVNPITITTLTDNIYGNIGTNPAASNTCDDLIGDVLAPGASSAPCSFQGDFMGAAGASQTDVVTVLGTDANGNMATDDDDAVVTLLPLPQIQVVKTASPLSRVQPGGTFTFTLVVSNPSPNNPITITTLTDNIYGNIGTNPAASNTCDDLIGDTLAPGASSAPCSFEGTFTGVAGASQTDVVTVLGTDANGNTATDTDDAVVTITPLPQIQVVKTASPLSRVEPGGTFTFSLVVSNPGPTAITITTLTDNIYGNIGTNPAASNTCDDLIGDVLAPGASSAPCSFEGNFTGAAGASQTDIVTVLGTDANGNTATDTDDATVTLLPLPQIQVVKTASPLSRVAPGGTFTFTLVVSNPSPINPITITTLTDNIYGNIGTNPAASNTCDDLIGDVLAPGASSAPCSFDGAFNGAAGASQTDVVTVLGTDASGNTATDTDDATVTLLPLPQIQVVKTASPLSRVAPGGTFTFTLVVSNPSPINPITITTLTDDIYGNIGTNPAASNTCDDLIGDTLAPGASSAPCSFQGTFTGVSGASQTDVVTVVGTDANGNTANDTDDATVTISPLPQIQVVKTAAPLTRVVPGGTFTFSLVVSNPGPNAITITTLTDNIYGNIGASTAASNTCDDLIGDVLAPGASSAPCSFEGTFTGAAGASQTDVVTVVGTDANGNTANDTDDATVTIVPQPQIQVVKTASPLSRPAPGGTFTFSLVVSNPGPNAVEITALTDDIYGNIGTSTAAGNTCDDLIGDVLAPAASATCSFDGTFSGASGASQTDVVTVTGTDDNGTTVTDTDDAVVTLTPSPTTPVIAVTKAASPSTLPAPGGDFTFTVTVSNPSASVPIRITTLTDDIYGNLATITGSTCGALIGVTLSPGATSAPCSFPGRFTGASGAFQTDTVTVTGVDSNGNTTSATAQATVGISPAVPPPPPPPLRVVDAVTPGTARISGPSGCVPRPFSVLVTGRRIRRVTFYLDGRRVSSLVRPNSGNRYVLRVRPGSLRRGTHRVIAITSFTAASETRQRILRLVFQRCARKPAAPRFTG